ncbi:MAG: BtaA family protein [Balneolaceae bacterium]|jgi:S-adenosylmethionine-diacylglycerol 3-amino-3-carboxypropyl transferase
MTRFSTIVEKLQHRLFKSVVSNNLVYNSCWEDPRVDRELLELSSDSKVVMLTSAGCNALDYLLDDPEVIHCVDSNPAQNALLELKVALFNNSNYQLLWDFFGKGKKTGAEIVYYRKLRKFLASEARSFWDQRISYFSPNTSLPSFYFRGTSGKFALMIHNRIMKKGLYPQILKLLNADNLSQQAYYFEEIEPKIWNNFQKWLIRQHVTMAMLGVPATQRRMIEDRYKGGLLHFIRSSLKHVFTELPLKDNYFWRVYITGAYTPGCCPNYLANEYFHQLQRRVSKINTHTRTLLEFLKRNPGKYSHFILLDHQDWLADKQPKLLAEEWKHILHNAAKGCRILFRSAGNLLEHLPDFVFQHLEFREDKTAKLHQIDRVGTYESTHLAIVK